MPYQEVPINVAGPSYVSRSLRLSGQRTVGYYQEINPGAKSPNAHLPFPGLKEFGVGSGKDRGATRMADIAYRVAGTTLYKVASDGTHTNLGTIPGAGRCNFANDGTNLFIITGSTVYQWDGSSVSTVSDTDIQGSVAVTFQNRQFIYTKPPEFIVSDVGDGSSASALNAAQAESQPDALVRAYSFKDDIFMFGTRTCEPWYNTGSGSPPYDRITGQIAQVGLQAFHSLSHNDNYMYFLGDDDNVYQSIQGQFTIVSSVAVAHAIQGYDVRDDAVGWCFSFEGQNFYCITFPTAGKTWLLNENLGPAGWSELSSGVNGEQYRGSSHVHCYGKNLICDHSNGKMYELGIDTYTDNDEPVKRTRTLPPLNGYDLGMPGRRLQMRYLVLEVETGVGLLTGQGSDPQIMVEFSTDGGATYVEGAWVNIGQLGERAILVKCDQILTFYDLVIKFTATDPVFLSIHRATISLRPCGRW